MGRVTIFAIDDCPFCKKAKSLLTKEGIEYYEINLSDYPYKRPDMLKAAKSLTVPQIFFNDHHVGGATELEALMNEGKFDELWAKTQQGPDPIDPLLQRPDTPPAPRPKPSPRKDETMTIGEAKLTPVEAVRLMERKLKRSFKGSQLVDLIADEFKVSREDALAAGKQFQELGLIKPVDQVSEVRDDTTWYWLTRRKHPLMLNTFRAWKDRVDDPMVTVETLKKWLGRIVSRHRNDDGLVDYVAVNEDPEFDEFDEASCELQGIDLGKMDTNTKLAFLINVYNMAITHAFAKVGAPKSGIQRSKFFPRVGYKIGGHAYSFDHIEGGLLRGNRPGAGLTARSGPIPLNDPRLKFALKESEVDNRIHFALNCGAKSCPPVKKFSAEAVKDELDIVAKAFFMQPENFRVEGRTVHITKILGWYSRDFGKTKEEVVMALEPWISAKDFDSIRHLVETKTLKVEYNHYDWSNDALRTVSPSLGGGCTIV